MITQRWWALVIVSVVAVSTALGLSTTKAGEPGPATLPADKFASERAMAHVRTIASEAHPTGSIANDRVRAYLIGELSALGLDPQVQSARVETRWRGAKSSQWTRMVGVENVVVRIPGYASTGAVLLAGHYDSVASGPGAADDAHASAAFLEMLRALRHGEQLKNDLIVLFTDGEETGLAGAAAFVDKHPWARDVRRVVNFEARGVTGRPVMFEATHFDDAMLGAYESAVPSPSTNSLAYEVYKTLPNDTDYTIFRELDVGGMGFGFIGDVFRYHTVGDSAENLDEGTLQYVGVTALGLARNLGSADVSMVGSEKARTFFSFGPVVVAYPNSVAFALAALLVAAWVLALVQAKRRRGLVIRGVFKGFVFALAALVISLAQTTLLLALLRLLVPSVGLMMSGPIFIAQGEPYGGNLLMAAFVAAAAASTVTLLSRAERPVARFERKTGKAGASSLEVALGAVGFWLPLAVLVTLLLPQGAFIFVLPPLFVAIPIVIWAFVKPTIRDGAPSRRAVVLLPLLAGCAVTLFMLAPTIQVFHEGMTLGQAVLPTLLVVLTVLLMSPLIDVLGVTWGRRTLPVLLVLAFVVFLVAGSLASNFTAAKQRPDSLSYLLDTSNPTWSATWASFDRAPDKWNEPFLGRSPDRSKLGVNHPSGRIAVMRADAPLVEMAPPVVEKIAVSSGETDGGERRVFRVRSVRGAKNLSVAVPAVEGGAGDGVGGGAAGGVSVTGLSIDGVAVAAYRAAESGSRGPNDGETAPDGFYAQLINVPDAGVEISLEISGGVPPGGERVASVDLAQVRVVVTDATYGLPPSLGVPPRPADAMESRIADQTWVQVAALI